MTATSLPTCHDAAAYVGEQVIIRYDPRDMAEIRVLHDHRFLCRAICAELAGETIALREIIQARTQRRQALRQALQDRACPVAALLEAHRGSHPVDEPPVTNAPALTLQKDPAQDASSTALTAVLESDTVFYTPAVVHASAPTESWDAMWDLSTLGARPQARKAPRPVQHYTILRGTLYPAPVPDCNKSGCAPGRALLG